MSSILSFANTSVDDWFGFKRHIFDFEGYEAWLVEPEKKAPGMPLLKIASPVTLRLELVSRCRLPDNKAYRHLDARTYELTVGSVEEALFFNW